MALDQSNRYVDLNLNEQDLIDAGRHVLGVGRGRLGPGDGAQAWLFGTLVQVVFGDETTLESVE